MNLLASGILAVLLVLLAGALYLSYSSYKKRQLLSRTTFQKEMLPSSKVIFINHRGLYQNMEQIIKRVREDFSKYFVISNFFAIYYPELSGDGDRKLGKSVVGVIVNSGEIAKIGSFMRQFNCYKIAEIPRTHCLSACYPFINFPSFLTIRTNIYQQLQSAFKQQSNEDSPNFRFEIYHFVSPLTKTIEIISPMSNYEYFQLWEHHKQKLVQ